MIDISNFDSHIFDALSQTSDNMYIYIADLERDFSRWSKPSVDYFNLPGEFIENTAKEWVQHIHPATTTHSQCTEEELLDQGIKPNTIRLSIGIEKVEDLIAALDAAFEAVK